MGLPRNSFRTVKMIIRGDMKILSVVGARPQFMKYYPIHLEFKKHDYIKDILVHTGQHYDTNMSGQFIHEFNLAPKYNLGVHWSRDEHNGERVASIIRGVESCIYREKPDIIVVYGDTDSSLGGAIASIKNKTPLVHVESGLRSYNKSMPEEQNRIMIDHVSDMLFCPCDSAVDNLKKEGIQNGINSGDVMYDTFVNFTEGYYKEKQNNRLGDYVLLTLHRAGNVDDMYMFENIIQFVNEYFTDEIVIFPMHPRTKKQYQNINIKFNSNVIIESPMSYSNFLHTLYDSKILLTDSGGAQKEAYWMGVPCVTLREETEWVDTISNGWNILYQDYCAGWIDKVSSPDANDFFVYGDGNASRRIVQDIIKKYA